MEITHTKTEFWLAYKHVPGEIGCGEEAYCPFCEKKSRAGWKFHSVMAELDKLVVLEKCEHLRKMGVGDAKWVKL